MDIRFTQNIYPSAAGGDAKISYYVLFPVSAELRGIVQISHGMCEYFPRHTSHAIRHLQNISALSDILFAAMTIWVMVLQFRRPVRWAFLAITTAGAS